MCVGEDHDDGDDDYHDGDDDDDHDEMRTDALPYQPMVIRLHSLAYSKLNGLFVFCLSSELRSPMIVFLGLGEREISPVGQIHPSQPPAISWLSRPRLCCFSLSLP